MEPTLALSKDEFQNIQETLIDSFNPKLILVCRNRDLEEFLEKEHEKLTAERHACRGVRLNLRHKDKILVRYAPMSRFFTTNLNEAILEKKFADFGKDDPDWSQIFPWAGKSPSEEDVKNYYTERFSISPGETVRWSIIYF